MAFFKKNDDSVYDGFDNFTRHSNPEDTAPLPGRITADDDDEYTDAMNEDYKEVPTPPRILKLGDRAITQIAAINKIAKENGWDFSVEFPGSLVDMYFEGKNYKIFCTGVDYNDDEKFPTGEFLASLIQKKTASYDQQNYIYKKEQSLIESTQKMITEDDIKRLRGEALEIRTNLDGLISGLKKIDPRHVGQKVSAEEFGKKSTVSKNPAGATKPIGQQPAKPQQSDSKVKIVE